MFYKDLEQRIFESDIAKISDHLYIISGYVGPETIKKCADFEGKKFTIIYGMYGQDSISKSLHDQLVDIVNSNNNITIKYSLIPVHSKIYCWEREGCITELLVGSANFSISGLRRDNKETLYPVSSLAFKEYLHYRQTIEDRSIDCSKATKFKRKVENFTDNKHPHFDQGICTANFLDSRGSLPKKSGLNWGYSPANVCLGDAYIPIRVDYIRTFPQLFPPKKYVNGIVNSNSNGKITRANDEIEIIWDDKTTMIGLLEGNNTLDEVIYPNKICSSKNKKELGDYLRMRLKSKLGKQYHKMIDKEPITKELLVMYGRTTIDISLISDGIYYLDFSV